MVTLNGQVLRRESVCAYSNARFLTDSMFEFAERLNAMRLNDAEIGLFNAVIVIAAGKCFKIYIILCSFSFIMPSVGSFFFSE